MTKQEFIDMAVSMGYASREDAKRFANGKSQFTEQDFEELYRYSDRMAYYRDLEKLKFKSDSHGTRTLGNGARTTKRYTVYNGHDER